MFVFESGVGNGVIPFFILACSSDVEVKREVKRGSFDFIRACCVERRGEERTPINLNLHLGLHSFHMYSNSMYLVSCCLFWLGTWECQETESEVWSVERKGGLWVSKKRSPRSRQLSALMEDTVSASRRRALMKQHQVAHVRLISPFIQLTQSTSILRYGNPRTSAAERDRRDKKRWRGFVSTSVLWRHPPHSSTDRDPLNRAFDQYWIKYWTFLGSTWRKVIPYEITHNSLPGQT
jgi:hypothetical protein